MAYCKKCGAYIPIDETACPACGYDPEAEARREREEKERAEAEARRKAEQEKSWAAQEKKREEEARRREQQHQARQDYAHSSAAQSQSKGENWVPPWSQGQTAQDNSYQQKTFYDGNSYADMRRQARDSVENQRLSVLSYLGMLFIIPLLARKDDPFAKFHSNQGLVLFLTGIVLDAFITMGVLGSLFSFALGIFQIYCTVKGISNVLQGKMEPLPIIGSIQILK